MKQLHGVDLMLHNLYLRLFCWAGHMYMDLDGSLAIGRRLKNLLLLFSGIGHPTYPVKLTSKSSKFVCLSFQCEDTISPDEEK